MRSPCRSATARTASYEVTVSVRDSKDASGNTDMATDATITVTITCHQRERTAGDVATYTADDPEGASIAWDLLGDDNSLFSISTLGVLTFRTAPDFEARADADNDNEYHGAGFRRGLRWVTVTVTDENGTSPRRPMVVPKTRRRAGTSGPRCRPPTRTLATPP